MKEKREKWHISIVFMLFGVFFIILGISNIISMAKFEENAVQTTATVMSVIEDSDVDSLHYDVYVKYKVNGEMYEGNYSTGSRVTKGSIETIYYDATNPTSIKTKISYRNGIIAILVGLLFGASGIVTIFNKSVRKKIMLKTGDKIYADFKEVTIDYSHSVNGRSSYIIICIGKDNVTGEERTFKSERICYDPENEIKERNITTFPVYIDVTDRKEYYLSLEELEKK